MFLFFFRVSPRALLFPCMPEAAIAPFGIAQVFCRDPFHAFVPGHYHLGDPVSVPDAEILIGEVDQDDFYLAPVVGVDGSRRVEHGDAVLGGQPAAGADLSLESDWQLNEQAGRDNDSSAGFEDHGLLDVGPQIHPGRCRRGIGRERVPGTVYDFDLYRFFC